MEKNLVTEAERYLSSRSKDKRRSQALRIVAVLVVFVTIYALILPAVTMSNEVECGMVEHIHTESCWQEELAWPEPELACEAQLSGSVLIHTHDSDCYNERGELICGIPELEAHVHGPECYQEQRTLICGQVADPGHQHTASCYTYVRVESADAAVAPVSAGYTCGLQEGEGAHRHTEECYPMERAEEPICGQEESGDEYDEEGNLIRQGHVHTDECWMVRVHEKIVCGQEETPDVYDEETGELIQQGHHHTSSCRLIGDELCYQYGCGQHESAGHVHTADCGQESASIETDSQGDLWEQVLTCGEVEREPGHVHTDECYEIHDVLTCHKQEIVPHTHDANCYDENGALICGKTEILVHQHTDECFVTPEGGQELTRVLICGHEEHTHTEECYVKFNPKEEQTYYCGFQEHIHTSECYFPSGALKDTQVEHVHDLSCLQPPVEETEDPEESPDPAESEEPVQAAQGVMLEGKEFDYTDNPAFVITFRVDGFVQAAGGGEYQQVPPSDPAPVATGEELVEITNQMVPLAAMPRMMSMAALMDDGEPDSGAPPITDEYGLDGVFESGPSIGPEGTAVENSSQPDLSSMAPVVPEPTATPEPSATPEPTAAPEPTEDPSQQWEVGIEVETLEEDDPRLESVLKKLSETQDMENPMFLTGFVLRLTLNGEPADASNCTITATVQPTQAVIDYVRQGESGIMTLAEGDVTEGDSKDMEQAQAVMSFMSADGEMSNIMIDGEEGEEEQENEITVHADEETVVVLNKQVYPDFTVRYVSVLSTVETDLETVPSGYYAVDTIIDTSQMGHTPWNGVLGSAMPTRTMYISMTDGSVLRRTDRQEIYRAHNFNYSTANKLKHIDIVTTKAAVGNETRENDHYVPTSIRIRYALLDDKGEVIYNNGEKQYATDWENKIYNENTQLTNRKETAETKENFIYIEQGCEIEIVYETQNDTKTEPANFYDYDITDGKIYTTANNATSSKNGQNTSTQNTTSTYYANTYQNGINSDANYNNSDNHVGTGTGKIGFGNNNVGNGRGEEKRSGWTINRSNSASFQGCHFGLVSGMIADGADVLYNNVVGPYLFGGGSAVGKTAYEGQFGLQFNRVGDTYTLASVTNTNTQNLEYFKMMDNWNKTAKIYYNNFWPMDSATLSWGTDGHDLKFGSDQSKAKRNFSGKNSEGTNISGTMPVSDDKQDHNSYFGMSFQLEFDLADDYVGPLEYYFFGDDDMWVFLDGKLVCDIGGVHSSVGEYVDLWDYISAEEKGERFDTPATSDAVATSTKHTLNVFYTERGASGSTCWMQYTIPSVTSSTYKTPVDETTLRLEKEVKGIDTDEQFEFTVKLTDANGNALNDNVNVKFYKEATNGAAIEENITFDPNEETTLSLLNGQAFVITGLPIGARYTITEVNSKGYQPSFKAETHQLSENGAVKSTEVAEAGANSIAGQLVDGGDYVTVTCTNTASYELPETGGAAGWYTMAGVPLMAAAFCLMYKKKTRGEGAEDGA